MNRDEILAAAKESGLYGDIYGLYLDNRNDERVVAFASRIESLVRERLLKQEINLGFDTPEISLESMVHRYYSKYFDREEADKWTQEYLAAIRKSEG
jgi:hypothetical protein